MVATFAYDNGSRRTSRTLGDTPGTQTAWVYGRQDNLPSAINSGIAGASFTYTYDANKNKVTEGISAPMANFGFNSTTYDQADRLTAWNRTDGNLDQAWDLSLVGNWATFTENQLQQTRAHTAVHEIAAIDANPIAHDPAGNLIRNAGDTLDRYMWDFDNRLASADVDQDGTAESAYQYDALGRRVSKTVPDGEGSATTVFVSDGLQVLAEYPADAAPASPAGTFVYGDYIDEPVMMLSVTSATNTPCYYHQNSLYCVAAITDVAGTVVERYAYSAYGKPIFLDAAGHPLTPQASTVGNPYLFTGRRLDEETGVYYYRARMYDAELGRFVSRDPIGYEAGDVNLYRYVQNSPTNLVDPSGTFVRGCVSGMFRRSITVPKLVRKFMNWAGLGDIELDGRLFGKLESCQKCCEDGTWAQTVSGSIGGQFYAKGVTGRRDFPYVSFQYGLYFRAGGGGSLSYSYDGCSDKLSGSGCFTVFVEGGLIGQVEVEATGWLKTGAGIRGGINARSTVCLSCNTETKQCDVTLQTCVGVRARMWASLEWDTWFSKKKWEYITEISGEACTKAVPVYSFSI